MTKWVQRVAALLAAASCTGCSALGSNTATPSTPHPAPLADSDDDGRYDVTAWPVDEQVAVCARLAPLAIDVLGELAEQTADETGCSYIHTSPKPFSTMTLSAFPGERRVLDEMTDAFYETNNDVSVLSARSGLNTSPVVAVPTGAVTAHIDCGASVIYDVVLPHSEAVKEHVLHAEDLLCE